MSYSSILFIDSGVENFQQLLCEVEPSAKVVILDAQNDGVRQITKVLSEWPGCKTAYIIAHGTPGSLNLGSTQLSLDTLERYSWDLQSWFPASSQGTEASALFLYGCQVAAGDAGAEFVETLHRLTGAQIAASTTLVGHASQGGNWQLDYTAGQAQAKLPIAAQTLAAYPGVLAAPVISDSAQAVRAVDEEGTLAITGISVSDADAGDTQTVTLTVTEGVLNLDPTTIGSLTGVSGDGSGSVTFSGSQADVNAALDKLTYEPDDDYSGNDTLAITVSDGLESASRNVAIAVTPVNDDPDLTPSGISVAEGGNSAFDITNIDITDVDNDDVQIIVKIASLPDKGTLTFNGNPLVVGSTFSYDQLANLRYVHDGTQTTAPGGTSDSFEITVDDGAGGLIAATSIPVTITPVNQLPTASGTNNIFEGALDQPVSIAINDPDQDGSTPYTIEITELPEDGVLKLGGVAVTPGQNFSSEDLATLTYSHDGNDEGFGNPPPDSFKIKITDDGGGTGIPESSDAITIGLNIKPNNDDPTLVVNNGTSLNTADGLTKVITAADLAVSDPDSPTAQLTYTLTEAPDPTIGGLEVFNGTDWVRIGTGVSFTQDDLDNGRVRYAFHKDSTGNENFADSFKFQVRDGEIREYPTEREGGIWNADGSALETLTFNIDITVPPNETGGDGGTKNPDVTSNAPPVTDINAGIANLAEGGTTPITDALLRTTDTDNSASEIVYRITSLPTSGAIELNGVALGLFGSFTQDDIDNGRVEFNHAGNENFIDEFRFTVSDGTTVIAEQTFGIDVTPVNDAPTVTTSGSPFLPEEGTVIINNSYLSVGDVDGSGDKSGQGFATINTLTFQIVDNNGVVGPVNGTLQVERNGVWVDVDENTVLTKAELDGNKLRYVHDGSENFTDEFFIQATDDSGQTDSNTSNIQKVDITIAPLNDDPELDTSTTLTVVEGQGGIIKGTNGTAGDEPRLIYTDPDNTEIQRQYRVTDATNFGTLFLNGKALSVGSVFTQEDLDNDRISYTHDGSENYSDEFNFTVSDGGGAAVPGNYQIAITPINDAPTLTVPGAQNFDTAAPLIFSNGNNNAINIDDVDLASIETGETDIIKVTLDLQEPDGATYGGSTLTLGSTNGITVDPTDDGSSGKITIEGTLADVQNALDGLQVQVPNDEDRTLSLEVTVDDLLNGEPGSPPTGETVTKTIAINASNVNDDPEITSPATVSVNEDAPLTFTGGDAISISDADTFNSNNNTVTVSVTEGALSLSDTSLITGGSNDSNSITLTGSIEDINDALEGLSYEGDRNFNGSDTLTIVANDQGNFGSGGGSDITQTVDITVVPVNDRPRLTAPNGVQTIDDGTALVFSDANGNAITIDDNADLQNNGNDDFTVTVTVPSGTLSASGANVSGSGTDTLTITGTRDEINTALDGLSYSPADFNGDETVDLQVTVNDNANGGTAVGGVGDAREATETVTINVSSNNEAPALTAPPSITLPEDNQVIFENGNAISIDDPDDFGGELQVTLEVEHGILTLGSTANLTFVEGDGTDDARITIRGTEADLNAALEGLSYKGDADFNGPDDALSLIIDDLGNTGSGGNQVVNQSIDITVTPVNDAPTRTSPTTTLGAIAEDETNPSGSTVTALFSGNFQDLKDNQTAVNGSSADDLAGVAITNNAATADQGVWQWFDGTDWNDIGNPSVGSALVLAAGTQVRFLPAADFNGTPGDLTVRLIDDSDGAVTSGATVDVSTSGGTTQYSNNGNAVTLSTEVTPVNDAPVATGTATLPAVDEDTTNPPGEQVSDLFDSTFSDTTDDVTGGSSANDLAGIAIVGNPTTAAEGTWEYFDGSTWQSVGTPSPGNALLVNSDDSLRFVPAADYNGPAPALSVHLIDDSNGAIATGGTVDLSNPNATGGTTPYSADPVPLESTVNPVNDDPTLGNLGGSVSFTEDDNPVVLDGDAIANDLELDGFGDWDGATLTLERQGGADGQDVFGNNGTLDALSEGSTLVVDNTTVGTVTTNSNGTLVLTFNGNATSALVDSVLQQITYSNASDDPPGSVEITYTLSDGNTGAQGSGGALTDTGSVTVNITPTSDKPVVTGGATLLYTENEAPQVVDNTLVLTDPDDTELVSATATISSGLTTGDILAAVTAGTNITASYDPDTGVLTLTGQDTLANYQQVMRTVTYESTSETPTATTRTVTWQVTDANSDNAGTESSTPITSTIQVNPLPDPVDDNFATNEDEALNGTVKDTDEGDGPGTYAVETSTSNGTLNLNPDGTFTYTPNPDFNGTDTFIYKVTDANGDEATATATITVNPVVDIDDDDATTNEDVPVKIPVLDNDSFEDPNAEITGKTDGTNGTVTINPDGTVTYTPDSDFSGPDTFTYTVTSGGVTETTTVEVTVNAVPDPVDDNFATNEDEALNGTVKDTDEGDGPGTYAVVNPTSNGTLTFNSDGTFTYTPNDDFNGTDTFTYKVTDANGDEATATATIAVNPVVDIDDDDAITNEDVPVKISVLDNDDFEDPNAEITQVTDGANGTVTINPDGTVTYTPNDDFNGTDTFTYTVTSGGVEETATVEVVVNPVVDIDDDDAITNEDVPVKISVLDNDDFEDPNAEITQVTDGANGTVTINPDGTVTYTPNDDFNGIDTFTYTVTSGGVEETATVEVVVNPVVDIDDDDAITNEDVPVKISVLDNDDFEDPNAEITQVTDGANGTVTINPDGTVTYTPNDDFNGTDTFTYTVTSGGVEETATVEVVVNPVVDIDDDDAITNEDVPVKISVLDNDDFEDPNAEITQVTDGANGTVTINPDGTVTYTPNDDFNGTDTFTYTVTSGGVEETATVEVVVNPVVDIDDDDAITNEDVPVKISVLDNDDFEDPNAEITQVTDGANGTVTINPDGTVTYTPNDDFNGTDTFTYTVTSGGVEETATVEVVVNPVVDIDDDDAITNEDVPVKISVLDNDDFEDPNAEITQVTDGANGTVTINPDGTVTYTPNDDFNGIDTFTYTVTSGGVEETATVEVVVNPVVDIDDDDAITNEDVPVKISVLDNDDFEDPNAEITQVTDGANGTVTINPDGTVTYTPNDDFNGTDTFTYTVTSGGVEETATVEVVVNPVVDIDDDDAITNEDVPVKISVLDNDDFEDPNAEITQVTDGANGTVTINPDGTVTYTPNDDFNGTDTFTYTVTSGGVEETATVEVVVNPVVDIDDDDAITNEDVPVKISVLDNDDFEDPNAEITQVTDGANGTVTINPDGTVTYTPNDDFNGTDTFTYTVTSGGVEETATVEVVVNPVVDIDDDDAITNEDVPVKISVLDNDDFEDPNAEITQVTDGANGTVTINPDGTVTYTPNDDFNGIDTFTYTVTSGGVEEIATVDVVVNPDDDITNNEVTTDEDTDVTIPVLDSFEDPNAEVTGKTDGSNGTVTINPDGTVTYTPNPDFNGTDTFTYTVTSGGVPETITVEVEVTPDIDIADDTATTDEDVPVNIPVLDNDDFEDPNAEITEVTDGANGTVTINPDGTVTYTPNPDFNGTDTFTYTVTSGGVEETATVDVVVSPDDDITNNEVTTDEDTDVTIPVLDSFEDPNAEVTGKTDGENGTVTINPDGTVTYTPNPDFNGTDTFTYTVTSGGVPETITVEVEVAPDIDITDDSSSTKEDTPVKISVLDNDEFEGTDAEITGVTNGTNGTVTINPDGTVTYTPNPDFSGTDTFTYTVTSGGVTETATVEVTVDAVPDPTDDSFRIREDAPLRGSVTDTDEGDGPATYALVGRTKNGKIVFNPDGTFTYTPNPDFNGTEEFTYTITDANGDAKTATARIVVTPVSDVRNDNATVKNSSRVPTPVTISALDNDTFEGDGATITSTTQGNNGAVVINRDGTVTYTPNLGFSGTDRFTYTITSGGVTETATIVVNVTPAGPTPGLGSSGGDIVVGTNGDDILNGFSDVDILRGLGGNDLINGGSSEDTMRGDSGNDVLNGGSGNDDMRGGSGNDILNGGSGNDFMTGGNGRDVLSGGTGNDRLYGNAARDILNGGGGRDRLQGGAGRDTLRGGRGNDLLVGGFGRDVLTGGQGRDQFIYTSVRDFGDVITDFEIVKDRINFKQIQQVQSMGDLRFNQRGTDTVVRADLNGTFRVVAVLEDVNANTMAPRHFIF